MAIALTDKNAMKERLLQFAERLLKEGHYVEFATHDVTYVRRFLDEVVPRAGVGPDRYEVQMLYGVPRDRFLAELCDQGVKARVLVRVDGNASSKSFNLGGDYCRVEIDNSLTPVSGWITFNSGDGHILLEKGPGGIDC